VVYGDPNNRYPTESYPRQDASRGLIGVEQALDDLLQEAQQKEAAETR